MTCSEVTHQDRFPQRQGEIVVVVDFLADPFRLGQESELGIAAEKLDADEGVGSKAVRDEGSVGLPQGSNIGGGLQGRRELVVTV